MRWIDGHCDVLSKMLEDPAIEFADSPKLASSRKHLAEGGAAMQNFAVWLSDRRKPYGFADILRMVDLFHERIASRDDVRWIRSRQDMATLSADAKNAALGAMLTLEGVDGLAGDLVHLRVLFRLGVRMLGLTWNHANWAADGVMEPRAGGLTAAGKRLIRECERIGMLLDVAHLAEAGFWQLAEETERPFLASHSNVYEVCPHPRNLKEDQVKEIIRRDGRVCVTFVPYFITDSGHPSLTRLLLHIDRICSWGGVGQIGIGSDFDGFDQPLPGMPHPGVFGDFASLLCKYYEEDAVRGFLFGNMHRYYSAWLPDEPAD